VENVADYQEIVEIIKSSGGEAFKRCFQCGLCDVVCPWNRVRRFSMRKIVRQAAFGMTEIESEDIWMCTTCGSCPTHCPRDVRQVESGMALRRIATEYGVFPDTASPIPGVSASLTAEGNPLNEKRGRRADWADGLGVKPFSEEMDVLLFPGCYPSYDPRLKKTARAAVDILKAAGVDFGTLGVEESCCGESVRKTGDEALFKRLAKANIKIFIDRGVKKILVLSPHCLHTFKNEYADFMVHFEVVHITQYLAELIQAGRLKTRRCLDGRITWHDPCYLGRHNGIYAAPRAVLTHISNNAPAEMPDAFENSLCCGGGGGRIWMETPRGERFADIRLEQALGTGADVLVTACPYCITNFEESRLTLGIGEKLAVKDITEVVREVI